MSGYPSSDHSEFPSSNPVRRPGNKPEDLHDVSITHRLARLTLKSNPRSSKSARDSAAIKCEPSEDTDRDEESHSGEHHDAQEPQSIGEHADHQDQLLKWMRSAQRVHARLLQQGCSEQQAFDQLVTFFQRQTGLSKLAARTQYLACMRYARLLASRETRAVAKPGPQADAFPRPPPSTGPAPANRQDAMISPPLKGEVMSRLQAPSTHSTSSGYNPRPKCHPSGPVIPRAMHISEWQTSGAADSLTTCMNSLSLTQTPTAGVRYSSGTQFARITRQIPCFVDGCKGKDPSISELLRGIKTHHNHNFCKICCEVFESSARYAGHKIRCLPHCIASHSEAPSRTVGSAIRGQRHSRILSCPEWHQVPVPDRWEYLASLCRPQRTDKSFAYVEGEKQPHGAGKRRPHRRKYSSSMDDPFGFETSAPLAAVPLTAVSEAHLLNPSAGASAMANIIGDLEAIKAEVADVQRKQLQTQAELEASQRANSAMGEALLREQALNSGLKDIIRQCLNTNGKRRLDPGLESSIRSNAPELLRGIDGSFTTRGLNYF